MSHLYTDSAPEAIGPYSQARWASNLLYSSGQIALDPKTGEMHNESIESETHQVMKNIEQILTEAKLNWTNLVKASIFLSDMNDFDTVNSIYSSYLSEPYPARETIQVARLPKDARIEISFIAEK